jgi:hypothetical protein
MSYSSWDINFFLFRDICIVQSTTGAGAARSRRRMRRLVGQLLENDFAMPAREITSRHGVDRHLLLPLAALRDTRRQLFKLALEVVSHTGFFVVVYRCL